MTATAQAAPGGSAIVTRPPPGAVVWAIALAGVAGAAAAATLAMTTGRTSEPEWQAGLFAWIVLTYTVGGAIAWWRRPDSRFGPLMVAAGAAMFVSSLYFADSAALFTLGQAFDLIPAALVLHVFLAYPSGRLGGVAERAIVAVAYVCAVGLQVVNMTLGNYGPDNLPEVTQDPDAGLIVTRVQLTTLSACMLAGVVVLVVRRRRAGRPVRLWVALLIDSFAPSPGGCCSSAAESSWWSSGRGAARSRAGVTGRRRSARPRSRCGVSWTRSTRGAPSRRDGARAPRSGRLPRRCAASARSS